MEDDIEVTKALKAVALMIVSFDQGKCTKEYLSADLISSMINTAKSSRSSPQIIDKKELQYAFANRRIRKILVEEFVGQITFRRSEHSNGTREYKISLSSDISISSIELEDRLIKLYKEKIQISPFLPSVTETLVIAEVATISAVVGRPPLTEAHLRAEHSKQLRKELKVRNNNSMPLDVESLSAEEQYL